MNAKTVKDAVRKMNKDELNKIYEVTDKKADEIFESTTKVFADALEDIRNLKKQVESFDVVQVVRCQNCRWVSQEDGLFYCEYDERFPASLNHFCAKGVKNESC